MRVEKRKSLISGKWYIDGDRDKSIVPPWLEMVSVNFISPLVFFPVCDLDLLTVIASNIALAIEFSHPLLFSYCPF